MAAPPTFPAEAVNSACATFGGTTIGGSRANFKKLITDETRKWAKVIMAAHMTAD
jgi:hypothetical protein